MPELKSQDVPGEHPARRPAVIAGASAGIGAAIARRLGAAGFPVAVGARRLERCEQLADEIRAAGGEALAGTLDVADSASVAAFAKAVRDQLGEVEVVVANAGLMRPGLLVDTVAEDVAETLNTNTVGLQRLVQAFVPGMIERGRGDLVVISSDVVGQPRPLIGAYVASKWAVEGLVRTLQMELEGTGVRASLVRPGPTATEIAVDWDIADAVRVVEYGKRFGSLRHYGYLAPDAIARTVAHLVSAPRGTHVAMSHVNPEAPIEDGP